VKVKYCKDSSLGVIYNPSTWKNVKSDMIYVDVGAFNGETTIKTMEKYPRLWALAIEPNPQTFRELLNKTNHLQERVRCINSGCWSYQGHNTLHIREDRPAGSTMLLKNATKFHNKKIIVPIKSLDLIMAENDVDSVDLLKIDTEGAEHEVLAGLTKSKGSTQFHIEYHYNLGSILEQLYLKDAQNVVIYVGRGGFGGSMRGIF